MAATPAQRYYASTLRKGIWLLLTLLLLRLAWFYLEQAFTLGAVVALLWAAFAASWVINLLRLPIVTIDDEALVILERLRFGRPNWIRLTPEQLEAVEELGHGRLQLRIAEVGERTVNLKYLGPARRREAIAAIRRFAD